MFPERISIHHRCQLEIPVDVSLIWHMDFHKGGNEYVRRVFMVTDAMDTNHLLMSMARDKDPFMMATLDTLARLMEGDHIKFSGLTLDYNYRIRRPEIRLSPYPDPSAQDFKKSEG
jgi:hypothetical protein